MIDQNNKKNILVVGDLFRAILVFLIPFYKKYMLILLLLSSTIAVFTDICYDAIIPDIVDEKKLKRTNSINETLDSLIMVLGPSLSGLLITFVDITVCFFIDAASFIISALLLISVSYHKVTGCSEKKSNLTVASTIKSAIAYIKNKPIILSVTITLAAIGLSSGILNSLLIVYVYDYLQQDSTGYGLLLSVKGMAMVLASIVVYRLIEKIDYTKLFAFSVLGLGLSVFIFPLNTLFPIAVILQFLNGICNAVYSVSKITILQLETDSYCLGSVLSINSFVVNVFSILSLGIFGIIADMTNVRIVLVMGGAIILMASFFSFILFHRAKRI